MIEAIQKKMKQSMTINKRSPLSNLNQFQIQLATPSPPPIYPQIQDPIPTSVPILSDSLSHHQEAIVLYSYQSQDQHDLTIEQGQKVKVIDSPENSPWVYVLCGDRKGYVPKTHIEIKEQMI